MQICTCSYGSKFWRRLEYRTLCSKPESGVHVTEILFKFIAEEVGEEGLAPSNTFMGAYSVYFV